MKSIGATWNDQNKEGTATNVVLKAQPGKLASSWSTSPIMASQYAAGGNFDGYTKWFEVVAEANVNANPSNMFISLTDDEFHNLSSREEYYGGEGEVLALGPVKCKKLEWYKTEIPVAIGTKERD